MSQIGLRGGPCAAPLPKLQPRSIARRIQRPARRAGGSGAAAAAAAEAGGGAGAGADPKTPWHFGAQTNERLLQWDASAQAQLSRIWLCGQLGIEQDQLDARLLELANLLPDMTAKLHALRAPLVLELLQDMPGTAARLVELRALLPAADVSAMVAQRPELLLKTPIEDLRAAVAGLSRHLPGVAIGPLVEREPLLLRVDAAALLAEVQRLMPGRDPVAALAADPGAFIDMEAAGLPSTLEFN